MIGLQMRLKNNYIEESPKLEETLHEKRLEDLIENESIKTSLKKFKRELLKEATISRIDQSFEHVGRCMNKLNESSHNIWSKAATQYYGNKSIFIEERKICERTKVVDESVRFLLPDYNFTLKKTKHNYKLNETRWNEFKKMEHLSKFQIHGISVNVNDTYTSDELFSITSTKQMEMKFHISYEFFYISYEITGSKFPIYEPYYNVQSDNIIRFFASKRKLLNNQTNYDKGRYNLLFLTIDSISTQHMERMMPKSFNYATNIMNFTNFVNSYVAGENTYPNLLALLSGVVSNRLITITKKGIKLEYKDDKKFLNKDLHYDDFPYIWKLLPAYYTTIYLEDFVDISTFYYLANGFENDPTDIYPRAFFSQVEGLLFGNNQSTPCRPEQFFYSVINDLLTMIELEHQMYGKTPFDLLPFFFWSLFNKCSHDNVGNVMFLDKLFLQLLIRLNEKKFLENTLIVIYGDHGARLEKYIWTKEGELEMTKSAIMIRLPNSFQRNHRKETEQFNFNRNKLVNVFDIHKSLLSLISNETKLSGDINYLDAHKRLYQMMLSKNHQKFRNSNIDEIIKKIHGRTIENRGVNLFENRLNWNRSCNEATIPLEYCPCYLFGSKRITLKELYFLRDISKDFFPSMFPDYKKYSANCLNLEAHHFTEVYIIKSVNDDIDHISINGQSTYKLKESRLFRFRLSVNKIEVIFETIYKIDEWKLNDGIEGIKELLNYVKELHYGKLTFFEKHSNFPTNKFSVMYWKLGDIVYMMNRITPVTRVDSYSKTNFCIPKILRKKLNPICVCRNNTKKFIA
ncbi:hypothetical protein SNEBB_010624 [Seison nebaliae]|nr:hypothetical protein SNEBB_010624 [Seison nebaliae]